MLFHLKTLVNWKEHSIRKQKLVDKANQRENKIRIDLDYQVVQKAYIKNDGVQRKMDSLKQGPFPITDVFTNGTVRVQCGRVNERINIRRL